MQQVVKKIDSLIGLRKNKDVYRGVMEFLNNKKNLEDPSRVEDVKDELTEAFIDFIMQVNEDTDVIVEAIQ